MNFVSLLSLLYPLNSFVLSPAFPGVTPGMILIVALMTDFLSSIYPKSAIEFLPLYLVSQIVPNLLKYVEYISNILYKTYCTFPRSMPLALLPNSNVLHDSRVCSSSGAT